MDFEKLGAFYLGKDYDVAAGQLLVISSTPCGERNA